MSRYANHTWSNSMRPGPSGFFVTAGETISTAVSSNLKMRSLAAIADWRMLYFSLKSMMGRKKRNAYCARGVHRSRRGGGLYERRDGFRRRNGHPVVAHWEGVGRQIQTWGGIQLSGEAEDVGVIGGGRQSRG